MKKFLVLVGVLVLGMVLIAGMVEAVSLYVPGSYTTIQAAVNAANNGDTIYVSAGTYNEAVYINKGIALVGVGTPTITAQGLGYTHTVTFNGVQMNNALISGFIITMAQNVYRGIYCNQGSPTITNNIISWNGIGIECNNSSPIIINNTIEGSLFYGILCDDYSSPIIANNIIEGNSEDGIHCRDFSSPIITNNTITKNKKCGVYCLNGCSPIITNNIIIENGLISSDYYGIYDNPFYWNAPIIDYNCVWRNGFNYNNNYGGCFHQGHDISANPQFIGVGDYYLGTNSPCIDAGSNTAPGIPNKDKDGKPRIINSIVDMGAYEYQDTSIFASDNNNVKVYPNPYKKGDPKFGGDYIYFGNVSQGAVIKIYNIAGELIKEIDEIDVVNCRQKWNISQENIASGVYIYTVTGGGDGKSVGKIGIIK